MIEINFIQTSRIQFEFQHFFFIYIQSSTFLPISPKGYHIKEKKKDLKFKESIYIYIYIVGLRAQIIYWAWAEKMNGPRRNKQLWGIPVQTLVSKERVGGGPMSNFSSGMINMAQKCIPIIRVTFQETPVIGMCIMNIRKGGEHKNI